MLAAVACGAFVTVAEPVTIRLLHRTTAIDVAHALVGGAAVTDTGWTLQRRIRSGAAILQAHRTHTYQQLCDIGWSHQRVTMVTATVTTALCLLRAASLSGNPALRVAADLAAACLLAAYLSSPVLLGRARVAAHGAA